jgi:hypothetical protein
MNRDSSVSNVTDYGLDIRGFIPRKGRNFPRSALNFTQPPSQWIPGASSAGVKRMEREGVR